MKRGNEYPPKLLQILLADDDLDDCFLFKEALNELALSTQLTTVYNGEELIELFTTGIGQPFDVLFLDLNMPRKNGFACLEEIKLNEKWSYVPVIIFSTSFEKGTEASLYLKGALSCIQKPTDFLGLKKIIQQALTLIP